MIALVAVLLASLSVSVRSRPLHPRICDNYSPLISCRDAPEVAVPGVAYGKSRQAYGSVLEGHKPFRLDHPAIGMIQEYAVKALESDISRSHMAALFHAPGSAPRMWGAKICSARALELKHTTDGVTARTVNRGGGRTVPVLFGITLQLQVVTAWSPGLMHAEDADHEKFDQRRSWILPLHVNDSAPEEPHEDGHFPHERKSVESMLADLHHPEQHGERESHLWVPSLWLAHRIDVSYDPSRSFSVQRHTWRSVGGGDGWMPVHEAHSALLEIINMSTAPVAGDQEHGCQPHDEDDGEVDMEAEAHRHGRPLCARPYDSDKSTFDQLGLPEEHRGKNETEILVAELLKRLCECGGGSEGEDANKVTGAGGKTWVSDVVTNSLMLRPVQEDLCMSAFDTSSDGADHMPDTEGNEEQQQRKRKQRRLNKTQTWELLKLREECAATFPASRSAVGLVAGTACPGLPESLHWVSLLPQPQLTRVGGASSGDDEDVHMARLRKPRGRLAEMLNEEAMFLASMPRPFERMPSESEVDQTISMIYPAQMIHEAERIEQMEVDASGEAAPPASPDDEHHQEAIRRTQEMREKRESLLSDVRRRRKIVEEARSGPRKIGQSPFPSHVCQEGAVKAMKGPRPLEDEREMRWRAMAEGGPEHGGPSKRCSGQHPFGEGRLRVMSFNAWNSNPPAWLFSNPSERWSRYQARMDHFADIILAAAPAIVGLQEVRLDITLGQRNQHGQMRHLAERLPGYQYVAQPATVYADNDGMAAMRDEEGVAIMSRYPIIASDYAVLSRDEQDPQDEHARVCLHAVVSTPDRQIGLVDVYSVHMPLSPSARNRATVEVDRFIRASRLGSVQILLGDMNDEPHNASMAYWTGGASLTIPGSDSTHSVSTPYTDAWLAVNNEPEPRSKDPKVRRSALTFPSDDPKKRIDTAFVASMPPKEKDLPGYRPAGKASRIKVDEAWVVGQDPVPGTGNSSNPEHGGMVHADSPLWASDHRGVVFDLSIRQD